MNKQHLITELQSQGLRLVDASVGASGRKGGAGPSDHKAVTVDGTTVMVPIYTGTASRSPYLAQVKQQTSQVVLEKGTEKGTEAIASIEFPHQPQFYNLTTADGIPYWKIALLHSHDVLATTIQQTCMRYRNSDTACQFCAIEKSLDAGRTIARKTPEQLAEVAEAAVRLDGVKHMIMTTGTPNSSDRGAAYLAECARAVKAQVDLPIQAQCEPPDDFIWFEKMKAAGIDSLGMHLEAADPEVRARIMPGKAEVPLSHYFKAFEAAVAVFGWGQVSTYLLAGLGDSLDTLVEVSDRLINLGVYPFVVPFVPITDTPLAHHPAPSSDFMFALYQQVGALLKQSGMSSADINAGCAKCGACSALSTFES
ncbi:MAG: MSMEG_0568 family radical SAM protein [Merismopedia sp. SIO2A8]|nr:MSMEG_0568 family radical SAM protein [Merismopedia sp. SIO2A8]